MGAQTDTVRVLKEVEIGATLPAQGVSTSADGDIRISSAALRKGMRSLGEADALMVASMLPGVNMAGDYSSGITVFGSDYTENSYTYDGATVFFPYRLGGIFSDFNPNHVNVVEISPMSQLMSSYNIGAYIRANTPDYHIEDVSGIVNVGLIASSATLKLPVGGSTSLIASSRLSHLNYLYDQLLSDDDNSVRYSFGDMNLTLLHSFNSNTKIKVSGILSDDKLRYCDDRFLLDTDLKWGNKAVSVNFDTRNDNLKYAQLLSYSAMDSRLGLEMPQFGVALPASVEQFVAAGDATTIKFPLNVGYRIEYNNFSPQYAEKGIGDAAHVAKRDIGTWLFSLGTLCYQSFADKHTLKINSRSSYYITGDYYYLGLDRSIGYDFKTGRHVFSVFLGSTTQFLHQVGFSDIGLASNFFLPAIESIPPQESAGVDLNYATSMCSGRLSLSLKGYAKAVFNASEYTADVMRVLTGGYDALSAVVTGDGYNIGGDITLRYDMGPVSGWAGYSLGIFRRKFSMLSDAWVPSATEPLHSIKFMADYRLNRRINMSAYFVLSSGRRYTPIESVYVVGGNIITEYGQRNSGSLPLYHRLDLSATYNLPVIDLAGKRLNSYVNLSLINAYAHDNIEMQYYDYDVENNTIQLRKIRSVYRFLPSISYSIEF